VKRICRVCGKEKEGKYFYSGQGNTCKKCNNDRTRKARAANPIKYRATRAAREATPERGKKRRETRLRRRYKLSPARIVMMLVEQDFRCKICDVPITYPGAESEPQTHPDATEAVVDHSHEDGHVRGLLCSACNVALGLFLDNLRIIKAAYHYIKNDLSSARTSTGG